MTALRDDAALFAAEQTCTNVLDQLDPVAAESLAELIAHEKHIWAQKTRIEARADEIWFAYRDAHGLHEQPDPPGELPEPMGSLYREAAALERVANLLHDKIVGWVPENVAEAATMLEFENDGMTELVANVIVGLRAIDAREAADG